MKPLATNSMIQNRYLVVQMIGKGGMGEVYLAVDQRLGSAVALKRTMFQENQALGSAFEREAKILGRLRHPVLPKVIDHFVDGSDQYLVMEHISGEDLGKRLEASGKPFPLSWVMFWADQLLDALAYLHAHEPPIIHRDIKPENLKLTDDNHIVLLDFGLSKDFDSRLITEPTASGSVVGYSPYFASMEQVRGTGTDARSDIYSLSATIYQLLTNTMPIDSLSRADTMLGGSPDPIEPISKINPEISRAISDVIVKGLAVRMDERYSTASEMQKALRRAFNQSPEAPGDETLPSAGEAATQIITNAEDLIPDETAIMEKPAPISEATEIMPESTKPTAAIVDGATSSQPSADRKQASVKTEVMPDPKPTDHEVEQETVARLPKAAVAAAVASSSPKIAKALPTPKKKSRVGLVVGSLLGLLVLGGVAAAGGWFAYTKYYLPSVAETSPTPVPAETVLPTPTPTATPETTGLTNSSETNSSIEITETNDGNTSTTNSDRPSQSDTRTTPSTTKNSGKTQPGTKPSQKPKGRDDRTVILQ